MDHNASIGCQGKRVYPMPASVGSFDTLRMLAPATRRSDNGHVNSNAFALIDCHAPLTARTTRRWPAYDALWARGGSNR